MLGMFVKSKSGHDKEQVYIIIKENNEYVYVVDGKYKTLAKPKKKNKKHIQPIIKYKDEEITGKLESNQILYDEEIKRAIKLYNNGVRI